MQEVFEKILERLEGDSFLTTNDDGETSDLSIQVVSLKDAKKIVQEVAEEYKCGWISVSERLPEKYGEYLIIWTDIRGERFYEICEYEPNDGWIGDIPQSFKGKYSVIAWQPLPEPYKGE